MVMQMENFEVELNEKMLEHVTDEALAKIADGSAVFTPSDQARKVMREEMDRIKARVAGIAGAASSVESSEYITGVASGFVYPEPAIRITERIGESEQVMEFATAEDYKVWKALNP